jgi:outer membrane protein insertion porin family
MAGLIGIFTLFPGTAAKAQEAPSVSSATEHYHGEAPPPKAAEKRQTVRYSRLNLPTSLDSSISASSASLIPGMAGFHPATISTSSSAMGAVSSPAADSLNSDSSEDSALPPPEPWVIGDIAISGNKNVRLGVILGEIKAKNGGLYQSSDLSHDIQSLLDLGDFERVGADITSLNKPIPARYKAVSGSPLMVKLTFLVTEKPIIKSIVFKGSKAISATVLEEKISLKKGDPLDTVKLSEGKDKILKHYYKKGFLDATVTDSVATDTTTLKSAIVFDIHEGFKSKIFWVSLKGVKHFKKNKIRGLMKNEKGKSFSRKALPEDIANMKAFYETKGFLDVKISTPVVWHSLDRRRIYIDISINEGSQYHFGDTTFSGNLVYGSTDLIKAVEYRQGRVFNEEEFVDTIRAIQQLYANKGYLKARVFPVKTYNTQTKFMDVHFSIVEGNVIYIERVRVEGNKSTKTYALRREIVTNPGDPFSAAKVKRSREMLMNLGFLDNVNVDIESPDDPNEVDLTYDVVEGKPGMMTAGGAYSTIMGLFGTLSLTNMNFLGRAQQLSANWSFGQRILMYSVNWSTPFIGDSPTSLGVSLFDSMQISPFGGSLYAYTLYSKGATVNVGPRFEDDQYLLNFAYTLSQMQVAQVQNGFQNLLPQGTSIYSYGTVSFSRDTRDNIWDPTTGSRNSVALELSGGPFMGQVNFFEPTLKDAVYFKLFSVADYPFVLAALNRASMVSTFGPTTVVPVFNRFFLGGENDLRGYEPTGEVGDPNGGTVYDVGNLEFSFPVVREHQRTIAEFVTFFDAGSAWDSVQQANWRIGMGQTAIKTDAGIGIRFTTPAFPIRLDWGYGFQHNPNEAKSVVTFGMGQMF